ncbi:MAG: TatD family hydrolase [Acidobacteriota bacterium]
MAVGEIGLDYHYMNSPREDQLAALAWQLDLALERRLPVVLHNRESWTDLEELLAERQGRLRGVCHSFAENSIRRHLT